MTEEERDDLSDLIMHKDVIIWSDESELGTFGPGKTLNWWFDSLGHSTTHTACCTACGCCTTCLLGAFYGSVVDTVLRELARVGALKVPDEVQP